ncbi:MAG: XTP/dITP diphosphatase [Lachnospiraceae bacterium]|nr:XTP/dITP diphosphatase [Lachnospiraceae bacterium]
MKILFATTNEGKMREIRQIMEDLPVEIHSLKDEGIHIDIDENGTTFEENAIIKAKALRPYTDAIVLADDSGLVVDYIGGEPGIYSARYMGEHTSYDIKNANIIERLKDARGEERSARFVCSIAACFPDGNVVTTEGRMEGRIAYVPAGENGFGFDPIMYLPEYGMTSAQLTPEEKNEISHRGKALRAMCALLRTMI